VVGGDDDFGAVDIGEHLWRSSFGKASSSKGFPFSQPKETAPQS
jgi:hypothetical protein